MERWQPLYQLQTILKKSVSDAYFFASIDVPRESDMDKADLFHVLQTVILTVPSQKTSCALGVSMFKIPHVKYEMRRQGVLGLSLDLIVSILRLWKIAYLSINKSKITRRH